MELLLSSSFFPFFLIILSFPSLSILLIQLLSIWLQLTLQLLFWQQWQHPLYTQLRIYKQVGLPILLLIPLPLIRLHFLILLIQQPQLQQFYVVSFLDGNTYPQLFIYLLK